MQSSSNSLQNQQETQLDKCKLSQSKTVKKELDKNEFIILSCELYKFNHKNTRQNRIICITNRNIINILPDKFSLQLLFNNRIKRKISLDKIGAITVSRHSKEFVIHIPSEYDYRYNSEDFRDQILLEICRAYYKYTNKKLAFYYKDDIMLLQFTKTKFDKKKKIIFEGEPQYLSPDDMKDNENAKASSQLVYCRDKTSQVAFQDFQFKRLLGKGSLGKVILCDLKGTKQQFAVKSIRKIEVIPLEMDKHSRIEKKLLQEIDFPFLVNLDYAFETKEKIILCSKYQSGGELYYHLKKQKKFKQEIVQFYAVQIVLAFQYLHENNIIYRDLKPENILLDSQGYIRISDYGLSKMIEKNDLAKSFSGTPEYMSPEIIEGSGHNYQTDWWSLGILLYEMLIGIPPFYNPNHNVMYQNIKENPVIFPQDTQIQDSAKDLIQQLLIKDPQKRLSDPILIKQHSFFEGVNYDQYLRKQVKVPFVPDFDIGKIEDDQTQEDHYKQIEKENILWINDFEEDFQSLKFIQQKIDDDY